MGPILRSLGQAHESHHAYNTQNTWHYRKTEVQHRFASPHVIARGGVVQY